VPIPRSRLSLTNQRKRLVASKVRFASGRDLGKLVRHYHAKLITFFGVQLSSGRDNWLVKLGIYRSVDLLVSRWYRRTTINNFIVNPLFSTSFLGDSAFKTADWMSSLRKEYLKIAITEARSASVRWSVRPVGVDYTARLSSFQKLHISAF
jgi:hypothetical protein